MKTKSNTGSCSPMGRFVRRIAYRVANKVFRPAVLLRRQLSKSQLPAGGLARRSMGVMLGSVALAAQAGGALPTISFGTISPEPSEIGQAYTVPVTVSGGSGTPTGTVTVDDGDGNFDTFTLSGGTGSATITSTSSGAKTLTANYGGDATYDAASDSTSHTVTKRTPTVTITGDAPDPSSLGGSYTVSVSVTGGGPTPTGTVNISDGEGNTDAITLSGGSGSGTLTTSTAGAKTLTASYSGDTEYNADSTTTGHTVNTGSSTVTIVSDNADPSAVGDSYTVVVSVSGSGVTPTGTVIVNDGDGNSTSITLSAGGGSGTITSTSAGSKTLTANYGGDGNYNAGSTTESHTVSKGTATVSITSDASDPSAVGEAYTVQVSVSGGGDTPTGSVTVDDGDGNSVVISLSGGTGSGVITSTIAGAKTLTANYGGDANYNTASTTEAHTVNKGTPTVAIVSDNPDASDLAASYTINVSVTGGGVTPTGTVTVDDGEGNLTTITLSGGTGSGSISTSTAGAKTLTASYGGDANYNAGSDTEPHTVNKGAPTATITSDAADPSVYAASYTVAVSVTGAGVTPTGTVTVDDGDGNTSTITLAGGTGSVAITPAGAGGKTLTATYNGDANYLTDSDTEPHTVSKATPTVTITSDTADPNNVNDAVTVTFTVTPPNGGTPSGNVIVSDDTGVTTTVTLPTTTATLDCMPVGSRTITAAYQGDANFNAASDTEAHTVIGPDIVVLGNATPITDGDTSPSAADDTDYGSSGSYPYVVTKTYTIRNDGTDTLNLTGPSPVTLTGVDTGPYTIVQPAALSLGIGASTTFTITFAPEIAGAMDAVVHIASDDKIKPDFDYAVTGMIVPSAIDTTYNPGIGPNQKVIDVEVQEDGKAVIVGGFITYNNVSRRYVARVAVDGSLDTTFDPGTGASHHINAVDIHTGGKILIGGRFTKFDGATVNRVARLNTDGSLDTTFQTINGGADAEVWALAVQPDQKILIGGAFTHVNAVGRVRIARLNSDGTLDASFNAGVGPDLTVRFIELQADGKILVGGHFRKWNGVNTARIIRLNSDGSVDNTFSSPLPDNGYVSEIIKDEGDGDIYISGGTRRLLRLNNDGSVQWEAGLSFNSDPNAILLTQDGKIITGGYFTKHGATTRTRLARLNSNGTLDAVFDPDQGANKRFLRLALQPDGRIIGVGEFTTYRGQTRNFITRMINDIRIGPFFSLQPVTQTVEEGTVFTLATMAEGQIPVTYQWFKQDGFGVHQAMSDGGNISGTASKDLVFNTITAADAGVYKVVATNPNGSTDSDEVTITVTPNQAPTIDALANLALTEDDPQQTVNLTGVSNGAAHESGQTLAITATSSDTSIIPDPTVAYTSGESTGTLTFTPVADAHGTATVTVTATDNGQTVNGGVTTTVRTFDVIVASVNDTPTLTITPTTFTVNEDSGPFTQNGFATFSVGPANEAAQALTLVCNNDNTSIFSAQPAINSTTGDLTFTPADDAFGTATVTVSAQDDGGGADTSPTRTFTIIVNAVNDQPSFTLDVSTVNFVENSGFNQVTIITTTSRGPANEATQKVDRYEIVGNTNPGLLTGLEVSSNGILKANTVNGVTGSTVITLQMVDNGGTANGGVDTSATQSFTITVGPQNFPPDFDLSSNLFTHLEDSGAHATANFVSNVGPGDVSEAGQNVTFTISAANPTLFAAGPTLTANGSDYDLSYTLAADAAGSTLVTVTGTDDGPGAAAQNKTFTITITDINDPPSFSVLRPSDIADWGRNASGQLDNPVIKPIAIAGGAEHTLALLSDGTVQAWGDNSNGETDIPAGLSGVTAIAAKSAHNLALKSDGTVVAWGFNNDGQINVPAGLSGVTRIRANGTASFAIKADGTVVSWGRNNFGQRNLPAGTEPVLDLDTSGNFTVAVKSDGTVVAFGQDAVGQLDVPAGLSGVVEVAVGSNHTLARKSDGTVVAWGWNNNGQIDVPAGLTDVIAVAANGHHSMALKRDGTVLSWGSNVEGESTVPSGLNNVTAIAAGGSHQLALVSCDAVSEDSPAQTLSGFVSNISPGTSFESGQSVSFQVSNDNNALFSVQPAISSAGALTYTPTADAHGSAVVSIVAADNGGTANGGDDTSDTQTFLIFVNAVNDEPSFTSGGDVSVFRGDGAYDAGWAAALNTGAANESGQTLTFNIVNNDNPGLFDSGPVINGTTGNLSFTPSASANGTANITVELMDDGGTANGGDDTSPQVTFAITISGTRVFVDGNPGLSGDTVTVPIDLDGTGTENSVSFTLDYDANNLTFDSGSLGAEAGSATLVLNSATSGKVGVLVILPANSAFSAGNNNIANLTFTLASSATAGSSSLSFSSSPVLQQLTETDASIITGTAFVGATVTLTEGTTESDVAPRPLGNGSVSIADATQVGRFAAGLDSANNGREFQAADSAPMASGGDGVISIADWVQSLRDAAALDGPARALAGPTQPSLGGASLSRSASTLTSRKVTLETNGLIAGRTATIRLVMNASGEEAGLSCSVQFDPNTLAYAGSRVGAGANGGMLIVNSQQAANGTLGIVLALPPGQSVPAGSQVMVEIDFLVGGSASGTSVALNNSPVIEEVTDTFARRLPASFSGGTFPVQLPAGFAAAGVEMVGGVPRFTFGNEDGTPVTADQLTGLEVYVCGDLGSGVWTRLDNGLMIAAGRVQIVDPEAGSGIRFYQVKRASSGQSEQ